MATKNAGRGQSQTRSGGRGGNGGSGGSSGGSSGKSGNKGGSSRSQGNRGGSGSSGSGSGSKSSRGSQSSQRGQSQRGGSSQRSGKSQQGSQRSQRGGEQQSQQSQQGTASRAVGAMKGHPYISAAVGAGLAGLAALGVRMMRSRSKSQDQESGGQRGEMDEQGEYEGSAEQSGEEDSGEEEGGDYEGEEQDDGGEEEYSEDDDEEDSTRASSEAPDQGDDSEQDDEGPSMTDRVRSLGSSAWAGLSRVGSRAADAVRSSAGSVGDAARTGYQQGQQAADEGWERHPLLICASALALGAAAGLMLPSSRIEDKLLGKRADKVTRRIKSAGSRLWEQGQHVVSEAGEAIANQAEREGLTPQRLGRKMKRIATHVRDAVSNALND